MLIKPKASMYIKNFYKNFKGFKLKFVSVMFVSLFFFWLAITGFNNRGLGNLARLGERIHKTTTLEDYNNMLKDDVATLINLLNLNNDQVKSSVLTDLNAKAQAKLIIENYGASSNSFNYWFEEKILPEEELNYTNKIIDTEKGEKNIEKSTEELGSVGKFAAEAYGGILGTATDIATGPLATLSMMSRSFGGAYNRAKEEGADRRHCTVQPQVEWKQPLKKSVT